MTKPEDYMNTYGGTGMSKLTHFLDGLAKANPEMTNEELLNQIFESEPKDNYCESCGKRNGGHYIMCSAWID